MLNVHNRLCALYNYKKIGVKELLVARDRGYIDDRSVEAIMMDSPEYTLDEAVKFKSAELSYICNKNILAGIDITLSDGEVHHFSLDSNDQLNMATKMIDVATGQTELEYHSDGDPCVFYSAEDMTHICVAGKYKVTFETTYFNCMKQWLKNCKTVEEVLAINYGDPIPEEYQTPVWKSIVARTNDGYTPADNTQTEPEKDEQPADTGDADANGGVSAQSDDVAEETTEKKKTGILSKILKN